jgi:uncharacterized membrane protein
MPKLFENAKRIGRKIGLDDDKGYGIAVFLALIVVVSVVAGFFINDALTAPPEGYNTLYILDADQKATNYPEILIAHQNSTFNLWIGVENHNPNPNSYQVQVKITKNLSAPPLVEDPVQVHETGELENGGKWLNMTIITQDEPGEYVVVFELHKYIGGVLEFTDNYCVLNIRVIN